MNPVTFAVMVICMQFTKKKKLNYSEIGPSLESQWDGASHESQWIVMGPAMNHGEMSPAVNHGEMGPAVNHGGLRWAQP
jgi:hypothetical protein